MPELKVGSKEALNFEKRDKRRTIIEIILEPLQKKLLVQNSIYTMHLLSRIAKALKMANTGNGILEY